MTLQARRWLPIGFWGMALVVLFADAWSFRFCGIAVRILCDQLKKDD